MVSWNCFTVEEGCKNKRLKSLPFLYNKDKYTTKEIRKAIEFRNRKKNSKSKANPGKVSKIQNWKQEDTEKN